MQGRLGPGDIGPKVPKKKTEVPLHLRGRVARLTWPRRQAKVDPNATSGDIWDVEEVPEESMSFEEDGDERPEPE